MTTWGPLPDPRLLTGDEPIRGADATLRDFWAWGYSDLRANTVRPLLAEFPVARAVGAALRRASSGPPTTSSPPTGCASRSSPAPTCRRGSSSA